MSLPVVEFNHVTKDFYLQSHKTFKEFFPAFITGKQTHQIFSALSDISFTVNSGETLGIIGPNGSGKSTILKLIAGVMSPTTGKVIVKGSVSPLIELGAGMHPELTGNENIFLNGAILGLSHRKIESNFNKIVDFAELSEFIDQPVKHYSSGMYMRLAFAIAVHTDPQILIVDEILAVGDSEFQKKCFAKMEEFKNNGVTIIFVSHSLPQIASFCTKVIYLNHSHLILYSSPEATVKKYTSDLSL